MPEGILSRQKVWLGGFDLTTQLNAIALQNEAETIDVTTFGDGWRDFIGGLKTVAAQHEGFWDNTDGLDGELFDRLGLGDAPMSFAAVDAAEGDVAFTFKALESEYAPGATVGEAFAFSVAAVSAGGDGLVRGTLMHDAARSVSADGTGRQLGAVAAGQKLFAALHVVAASGTAPTLDVTIESDEDNLWSTPTVRHTFAQQTARGFEWMTPLAGPFTDDWWRLSWTIGGAGPSFTFAGIIGIQ